MLIADQSDSMGELEIDTDAMVDGFEKADGEDRSSAAASTPADPAPKSNKRCTLCSRWLPDHLFPSNGWRCCECRNAYDRLAKQVIRENQQEFWEEIRNDAMELKKLLRRYSESHIMYSKTQFDLGSYIKEFSATTNSRANAEGRMMWEGYFVQFAQTAKGGSYSEKEAMQRWHEMLGSPWVDKDNRGPARSPRRCRVPMYDEVSTASNLPTTRSRTYSPKRTPRTCSLNRTPKIGVGRCKDTNNGRSTNTGRSLTLACAALAGSFVLIAAALLGKEPSSQISPS